MRGQLTLDGIVVLSSFSFLLPYFLVGRFWTCVLPLRTSKRHSSCPGTLGGPLGSGTRLSRLAGRRNWHKSGKTDGKNTGDFSTSCYSLRMAISPNRQPAISEEQANAICWGSCEIRRNVFTSLSIELRTLGGRKRERNIFTGPAIVHLRR